MFWNDVLLQKRCWSILRLKYAMLLKQTRHFVSSCKRWFGCEPNQIPWLPRDNVLIIVLFFSRYLPVVEKRRAPARVTFWVVANMIKSTSFMKPVFGIYVWFCHLVILPHRPILGLQKRKNIVQIPKFDYPLSENLGIPNFEKRKKRDFCHKRRLEKLKSALFVKNCVSGLLVEAAWYCWHIWKGLFLFSTAFKAKQMLHARLFRLSAAIKENGLLSIHDLQQIIAFEMGIA